MASIQTYKVHYHGEIAGRKQGPEFIKFVQASANDYDTIKAILSSNNVLPRGTLIITSVQNIGTTVTEILS